MQKRIVATRALIGAALLSVITSVFFILYGSGSVIAVIAGVGQFCALVAVAALNRSRRQPAAILWFTGLSGSGKSTLAHEVYRRLQNRNVPVEMLDGDVLRDILPGTGFSKEERLMHIKRAGLIATFLERNGVTVCASFISPYRESRRFIREKADRFIEIHLSTPLAECEKRDVKGLYAKARRGEIKNFTGIDDPYEIPEHPELTIDTSQVSIEEAGDRVIQFLLSR